MKTFTVDLYEYFGQPKPEGGVGYLTCYLQETPMEISRGRLCPAMLVIPGGGYSFVSEREADPIAFCYLAKGFCSFVLHYAVAPLKFPVQLREAVMAMRYIRENAQRFGVHPRRIAAIGFSAGGHLCGTLGTMYDCPEVADLATGDAARPDGLVLSYAVLLDKPATHEGTMENISGGDKALRARLSIDSQVRPDMAPTFLWHTADDATVPVCCSLITAQALAREKVPFALHVYPHGVHGLSLADDTVYPHGSIPEFSKGVTRWLDDSCDFLFEHGITAEDIGGRIHGGTQKVIN